MIENYDDEAIIWPQVYDRIHAAVLLFTRVFPFATHIFFHVLVERYRRLQDTSLRSPSKKRKAARNFCKMIADSREKLAFYADVHRKALSPTQIARDRYDCDAIDQHFLMAIRAIDCYVEFSNEYAQATRECELD